MRTELATRMIELADKDGLPADHKLRLHAIAFDQATAGFYAKVRSTSVSHFFGAWAQARRTWCEFTGEPLV